MSMIVNDNTIPAGVSANFFQTLGKPPSKTKKTLAAKLTKNSRGVWETEAKSGTEAVSKKRKEVLSFIRGVIIFYHASKGFYLGKFVYTEKEK